MTKFSICILDDQIPAANFQDISVDDTSLIDKNLFKHFIKVEENWRDIDLFKFSKLIIEKNEDYIISGFTNHSFYFNYIENNIFIPDIIIFDWDMGDGGTNSEKNLLEILKNSFILVAIFTTADNSGEVTKTIEKPEFVNFKHNILLIKKDGENAFIELEDGIEKSIKHFSFQSGKELKKKILNAVDNVLSNLGTVSYDQFVSLFGSNVNGGREVSGIDYIDIIFEKTKTALINIGVNSLSTKKVDDINDNSMLRKIWNFRLYNSPKDDIVRKGDIVCKNNDKDSLFFIISSDCHLKDFWYKNLGYLTFIPLKTISKDSDFSKMLSDNELQSKFKDYKISSLISQNDGLSILPGINKNIGNEYTDYMLIPKSVSSMHIPLPKGISNKSQLLYSHITELDGEDRLHLSEPYLTPIIQFIRENITSHGVADFSPNLKSSITFNLKNLITPCKV